MLDWEGTCLLSLPILQELITKIRICMDTSLVFAYYYDNDK